ncbi:transcriptional regulator, LacI family [Flavobacterium aquidurense]|uniref:HTH lacI-type domain-containing protein n=1 Tax=Flavobacterium frigidimaris TaxID=262320 RepID=A0ABX4BJC7_FLAFR|nr:LacI family DNA-binding transcriptional regulator [Flavobacterium frigidimaris]OXA75053.1 hypothetical protein B0A65_22710 [Flavobacterium frigidimaris]SDZ08756.1 transcriptional regulator, LacI family [Flavobacterium aquidurense]
MKTKNISLKSIAEALNTSITTVSFVLNGKAEEKNISKKKTQSILEYAQKVNFKPNQLAQSLRTRKSKILVFMVEDISIIYFAKLARVIENIAYDQGYKVLFCSNENNDKKSIDLINSYKNMGVDGYIIVPSPGIQVVVQELIDENLPVILLESKFQQSKTNSVIIDNSNAILEATEHFIANNYKNIAFITTNSKKMQMKNRLASYAKAVHAKNLKSFVLKIPEEQCGTKKAKEIVDNFFHINKEIDAVLIGTNELSVNPIEIYKEKKSKALTPRGIIFIDENEIFKICTPTISAIAQPVEATGVALMNLMLKLLKIDNVKDISVNIIMEAKLIIRESSTIYKVLENQPKTRYKSIKTKNNPTQIQF